MTPHDATVERTARPAKPRIGSDVPSDQRQAREFLFAMHSAQRALQLYPLENQAVQKALSDLEALAEAIVSREGGVALRYVGDFCFLNDLRLRVDLASYATFAAIARTFRMHRIGAIEVAGGATRKEWIVLLSLLLSDPDPQAPFERFAERLSHAAGVALRVHPEVQGSSEREAGAGVEAKRTYLHSLSVARETLLGVRMGRAANLRSIKRAVQSIIDQVLDNESSMIGMTMLREYDQYTFAHSVNVCIFSVALGKKIGLSKLELYELGMGALLHDIGKARLPIELTTKADHLEEPEWRLVREHPTEGLLTLLEMRTVGEVPFRTMLCAYEHHMKLDQSGYPSSLRKRDPTLFSRIVAIADGFDAATTRRSYQTTPWLPDAVLREMRDNKSRGFDPLLVRAFISMTGYYPIGTLVVLDRYELAVVDRTNPHAPDQPVVRVLFDEMGSALSPPRVLDLTEVDPGTGEPLRAIIKTTDPERYGIDMREYFV